MIVAKKKPLEEIIEYLKGLDSILVLGCRECVTVCEAGGEKEVTYLASALQDHFRAQGKQVQIGQYTVNRQCDPEFLEEIKDMVNHYQAILSLACGAGVQFVAEKYPSIQTFPGVNTCFVGVAEESGYWTERCQGCGQCILAYTGGICPVARCAKRLLNGPCGGSSQGKCEVDPNLDCVWQLIIDKLKALGQLENYEKIQELKDWSKERAEGSRNRIREDIKP